jgi:hypothetical protein
MHLPGNDVVSKQYVDAEIKKTKEYVETELKRIKENYEAEIKKTKEYYEAEISRLARNNDNKIFEEILSKTGENKSTQNNDTEIKKTNECKANIVSDNDNKIFDEILSKTRENNDNNKASENTDQTASTSG